MLKKTLHTSLRVATALCKGDNHLLSLALTLAPANRCTEILKSNINLIQTIFKRNNKSIKCC